MINIYNWSKISEHDKKRIIERARADLDAVKDDVRKWLNKVQAEGDRAVIEYIRKFDDPNFIIQKLKVSDDDIKTAFKSINKTVLLHIKEQIRISKTFHTVQARLIKTNWKIETVKGVITGCRKVPIESVGLYVPAGKAPLPTVAQILTVAAECAKVHRKVVCFPPTESHYEIIVAAHLAGADEIYRIGGIAAIGALTYGTNSIKPVKKICGPGNSFVQLAKLQVSHLVGIDMLSGPSEALILADNSANPKFLAADILARCEHGPDSAGVLVTTSQKIAITTKEAILKQAEKLKRQEYIQTALSRFSAIIILNSEKEMIEFANEYSAEHLEIQTKNPEKIFKKITNGSSVFLGSYAPVAIGDYASGTNHCLPTGQSAAYSSAVSVETFLKTIQFQKLTKGGLKRLSPIIESLSDVEGLDAHKKSVQIRFKT